MARVSVQMTATCRSSTISWTTTARISTVSKARTLPVGSPSGGRAWKFCSLAMIDPPQIRTRGSTLTNAGRCGLDHAEGADCIPAWGERKRQDAASTLAKGAVAAFREWTVRLEFGAWLR